MKTIKDNNFINVLKSPKQFTSPINFLNIQKEDKKGNINSLEESVKLLNLQPDSGWSVGQTLEHIDVFTNIFTNALIPAISYEPGYTPELDFENLQIPRLSLITSLFLNTLLKKRKIKVKTLPSYNPEIGFYDEEFLRRIENTLKYFIDVSRQILDQNKWKKRVKHPYLPFLYFTCWDMIIVIHEHTLRHFAQIKNISITFK